MARRQIFSSFSVCQLGFLGGVSLDVLPWLGWQKHTFLDPDTWCVQGPNFDDLCACLSQCKCMLSIFTVPKLSSCYVFLMHPCCFCLAVMTTTYISRCWNIIVLDCSRTKFWWALCVSEPVHLYSLCEQYDPYLLSMVYPLWTRAQFCFTGSRMVTICLSNDAIGCLFLLFFR